MCQPNGEHARRAQKKCHDIDVKEINHCHVTQDRFLSNEKNKSQFIVLVSEYMRNNHQEVINCDADTTIVETAISQAETSSNSVVVVADDTDIAVMLMYHWKDSMADVIFYLERLQQG